MVFEQCSLFSSSVSSPLSHLMCFSTNNVYQAVKNQVQMLLLSFTGRTPCTAVVHKQAFNRGECLKKKNVELQLYLGLICKQ